MVLVVGFHKAFDFLKTLTTGLNDLADDLDMDYDYFREVSLFVLIDLQGYRPEPLIFNRRSVR